MDSHKKAPTRRPHISFTHILSPVLVCHAFHFRQGCDQPRWIPNLYLRKIAAARFYDRISELWRCVGGMLCVYSLVQQEECHQWRLLSAKPRGKTCWDACILVPPSPTDWASRYRTFLHLVGKLLHLPLLTTYTWTTKMFSLWETQGIYCTRKRSTTRYPVGVAPV